MFRFLLLLFFISNSFLSFSSDNDLGNARILTKEVYQVSGVFECSIKVNAKEEFRLEGKPELKLPKGWKVVFISSPNGQHCRRKSSMELRLLVYYPKNNLPFYPQEISIVFPVKSIKDTSIHRSIQAKGKVYFTPYNSVELFDIADFENSNRAWLNENSKIMVKRRFINKKDIPVSDLNISKDTIGGIDMEEIAVQLVYVPGLAYCVPMKIKGETILLENYDDGIDSVGAVDQKTVDELTQLLVGVSNDAAIDLSLFNSTSRTKATIAQKIKIKFPTIHIHFGIILPPAPNLTKNFKGSITGRLTSSIINDLGYPVDIPLSGVFIALKEKDKAIDEEFGYTHTDAQGYYTISYNKNQSLLEGNEIELYIQIKSKNEKYDIKAKKHAVLGGAYDEIIDLGTIGVNAGLITKNITTGNGAYRVVSWATRCWDYSKSQGIKLINDLSIILHANSSHFLADGFIGSSVMLFRPTIRLESEDCNHENTIYHEFGHFLMWNIQDFNYILALTDPAQEGHSWSSENTSRTAWQEGWADAYQMIMDASHWWEDKEYGFDALNSYDYKTYGALFENRRVLWQSSSNGRIRNGLWSEYFIACAIYDLWDGANKGVPIKIGESNLEVGYNDRLNGPWETDDDVEMSLADLAKPMIDGGAFNMISQINEYYERLLANTHDCEMRNKIAKVFAENRVVFDITEYEKTKGYGVMSSGGLSETKSVWISGKLGPSLTVYKDDYHLSYLQYSPTKSLDMYHYPHISPSITDYTVLGNGKGNVIQLNMNTGASINTYSNYAAAKFYTCGRSGIEVSNGTVTMGKGNYTADLMVKDKGIFRLNNKGRLIINKGSGIRVKSGGTLYVRSGAILELVEGAYIEIEEGGYVCIEDGVSIIGSGNSVLTISPGAILGTNPDVIKSINCSSKFCQGQVVSFNNEALLFDGIDDYVEVPETNGKLNLGTGDFTFEALFKSNSISYSNDIQMLVSKRNDFTISDQEVDGFMFGLWDNGHLYVQLGGTPNIGYDVGPNLYDGKCHHVAVSRKGGLITFYADGNPYYSYTLSSRNISSTGSLRIGRNHFSNVPFNGLIGEVRIWNHARNHSQILSNVGVNLVAQTGLVGYWDMNGTSSQIVNDISGFGNNGIMGMSTDCASDLNEPKWISASSSFLCKVQNNFKLGKGVMLEDNDNRHKIEVYPNPFKEEVIISISGGESEVAKVIVYDINGQVVYTNDKASINEKISIGKELPAGVYFMQVISGSVKIFKIIKE